MRKIFSILIILSLIFPIIALAAAKDCFEYCNSLIKGGTKKDPPENQVCICDPLGGATFEGIVGNLIDFIFNIAIILVPLVILAGAFMFVTAGGNPEQANKARKTITWAVVGFVVALLSKGIFEMIKELIGV